MKCFPLLPLGLVACALAGTLQGQSVLPLVEEGTRLPSEARDGVQTLSADLDGDGYPDLIHLEAQRVQTWLQQKETGRFLVKATLSPAVGTTVVARAAVGLFAGGDASPDVVLALSTGNLVMLRGDGAGGLTIVPGFVPTLSTLVPSQLLVANFDRQNGEDLLLLYDGQKSILLAGSAAGPFTIANAASPLPQLAGPQGVVVDWNGDGYPDLVMTSGAAVSGVALAIANTLGSLASTPISLGTAALPPIARIAAGDVTGDGRVDLVLGPASGTAAAAPLVFVGTGGTTTPFAPGPGSAFACIGYREIQLADLGQRGFRDLLVETNDGTVLVGMNLGGGSFAQPTAPLLDPGLRGTLLALDFDRDQDVDVFVDGAGTEALFLLGDGPNRWAHTERGAFPLGAAARGVWPSVLVDATGDGDPDVLSIEPSGQGGDLYRNDGSGRFLPPSNLPFAPLPAGSIYASVAAVGLRGGFAGRDLLVQGSATAANLSGTRVLVAQAGGGFVDETATRWPAGVVGTHALAVGTFALGGAAGASDVVVADGVGKLAHLRAELGTGRWNLVPNSLGGVILPNIAVLLYGSLNGDAFADLVAVDTLGRVFVWTGSAAGNFVGGNLALTTLHPGRRGVVGDFDGDGLGDLLLATPSGTVGLAFLRGTGGGLLVDASATWLPSRIPSNITSLERLGKDVLLGVVGGPVELMRSGPAAFATPVALPLRGSAKVYDLLLGDLDLDTDIDVVVMRSGAHPALLHGSPLALTQLGVTQGGRNLALRFRGPPGGVAFLFFAPSTARFPVPPYGILRLAGLTQLLSVNLPPSGPFPGLVDLSFPLAPVGSELVLPMQVASFDPGTVTVTLGNLENVRIVDL